jgi:hypothetical protein
MIRNRSGLGLGSKLLCNRLFQSKRFFQSKHFLISGLSRSRKIPFVSFWTRSLTDSAPGPKEDHNTSVCKEVIFLDIPVLIVGAGPVGTYLSILLSKFGIESAIVERAARGGDASEDPQAHPRAHVLNTRTMELMRFIGLEETIHSEMPPQDQWRHFR